MRALLVLAAPLALAACGKPSASPEAPASAPTPAASATTVTSAAQKAYAAVNDQMHSAMAAVPTDADEAFMRGMIAHHRGAMAMSEVELRYGKDKQARDLAQRIIDAQGAEIAEMEAWLKRRDAPASPAADAPATGSQHAGH